MPNQWLTGISHEGQSSLTYGDSGIIPSLSQSSPAHPWFENGWVGKFEWKQNVVSTLEIFDSGNWSTFCFYIYFTDLNVSSSHTFFTIIDSSDNVCLDMQVLGGSPNTVRIREHDGTQIQAIGGLEIDRWYRFGLKCQPENSSGELKLYLDGSPFATETGVDLLPTEFGTGSIRYRFNNPIAPAGEPFVS